ncbi:MAG: hypothetical protein FWF50_02695 [Defluviitaleaceae bacterium]|nr:hypothetical protein [Defluviitaleaceae bacterium]
MYYIIKNKSAYLKDNELIYDENVILKDIQNFSCSLEDGKLFIFAENKKGEILVHSEGKTKTLMHGKICVEEILTFPQSGKSKVLLCNLYEEKKLFILNEDKHELTSYKDFFALHKLGNNCVAYLNKGAFGYMEFSSDKVGRFKEIYQKEVKEASIVTSEHCIHSLFTVKNKLMYSKFSERNDVLALAEGEIESPLLHVIDNKIYIFFSHKNRVYYSINLEAPKLYLHKISYNIRRAKVLGAKYIKEVYIDPLKPTDVQIIEASSFSYKDF